MEFRIHIRSRDAASAAAALRSLGMDVSEPDRINPVMHFVAALPVDIVTDKAGVPNIDRPGVTMTAQHLDRRLTDIKRQLGKRIRTDSLTGVTTIAVDDDTEVQISNRHPDIMRRHPQTRFDWTKVRQALVPHSSELRDALRAAGCINPLIGNTRTDPATGRPDDRWRLLLDAGTEEHREQVQAILDQCRAVRRDLVPLAVLGEKLDAESRRCFEMYAFEIPDGS